MIGDPNPCMFRVFNQPGAADGTGRFHDPANKADIIFYKLAVTENILKRFKRIPVFCKKAQTACPVIKTMACRRRESIRILCRDLGCTKVCQRCAAAGIRLNTDTCRLVDKENVTILIDDGKR